MEPFGRRRQHQLLRGLSRYEVGRAVHTDSHGPVWWGERDRDRHSDLPVIKDDKIQMGGVESIGPEKRRT